MTLLINEVWIIFPTPGIWFVLFDEVHELLDGMNPGFA